MMEISAGVVKVTRDSAEEKEFDTLCRAIAGMPKEFLVRYNNEIIKLRSDRNWTQDMMLTAILYERGEVVKEYY